MAKYKTCGYCGVELTPENAGLDHKTPLSLGGPDHKNNLWLICQNDNRSKGNLHHSQFQRLMSILNQPPFDERARNMILRKLRLAWRVV